jgi:hypothetical protein
MRSVCDDCGETNAASNGAHAPAVPDADGMPALLSGPLRTRDPESRSLPLRTCECGPQRGDTAPRWDPPDCHHSCCMLPRFLALPWPCLPHYTSGLCTGGFQAVLRAAHWRSPRHAEARGGRALGLPSLEDGIPGFISAALRRVTASGLEHAGESTACTGSLRLGAGWVTMDVRAVRACLLLQSLEDGLAARGGKSSGVARDAYAPDRHAYRIRVRAVQGCTRMTTGYCEQECQ